jgi:purine-binding chemotaxis protein CheW
MSASGQNQYCTFAVAGLYFGVPVARVQEVILQQPITRVPLSASEVSGLINLRGQLVTAIELRRRLGLPERPANIAGMNVLIRNSEGAVSLVVDQIDEVLEVDPECVEPPPETMRAEARKFVLGAAKLKGRLMLLLDSEKVLDLNGYSLMDDVQGGNGPRT